MSDEAEAAPVPVVPLTASVVTAYLAGNRLASAELPTLIASVHSAFESIQNPPPEPAGEQFAPAVSVRKSLGKRDTIISMIDGKPYATLKRHLAKHGLTPEEYRQRYGLPADYPMVARGYSEHRSFVAKALGLGRKALVTAAEIVADAVAEAVAPSPEPEPQPAKASVGARRRKAAPAVDAQTDTPRALVETAALAKPRGGRPRKTKTEG
jgi:predicted transcriptional regulator